MKIFTQCYIDAPHTKTKKDLFVQAYQSNDIINIMIIKYDSYSSSDGPKIFDNKYSYSSDSKKPTYNNAKKPNNVIKI